MNTGLYTIRKQVGIGAQLKLIKTSEDSQGGAENHKGEKIAGKKHLESKTGSNRMTERRRKRYTRGGKGLTGKHMRRWL